jgi:hypothetical protein
MPGSAMPLHVHMKSLSRSGAWRSLNYICAMPKVHLNGKKPPKGGASSDLDARRTQDKTDAAAAWREYHSDLEEVRDKTARLRALRLSRERSQKRGKG